MKKLIIFILCLFLSGCGNYAELNSLSIVTGIAIDKDEENYEISFLIANSPKSQTSSKEGEAKTTVYTGKGKTIPEAAEEIAQISPKQLYFGHINVVIISEDIAKEGVFKVSDWLLRNPQTRKKFYLLQAKDTKAKNIIKLTSPLESFPSQSIATLIKSNKNSKSIATAVTYSNFIETALEKGIDPVLPSITIEGDIKKGSSEKNLETTEPEAYLKLGPLAIYKKDKLKGFTTNKESEIINILKNDAKEINYTLKNISIDARDIKVKTKASENKVKITIEGKGNIYEIKENINLENPKEIKKIEEKWNESIKKDITKVIQKMQEKETDVFGYGSQIYKNNPKKWQEIEKTWNKKNFKKLKIEINSNLKISATGSLTKTIGGK